MKKNLLTIIALLVASVASAQTKFESCSLKDAITKAKNENKMVLIIASATW